MACSPSGSSVHGILQARRLGWVAIPFSRGSRLRDQSHDSCLLHWRAGSLPLVPPGKPSIKSFIKTYFFHLKKKLTIFKFILRLASLQGIHDLNSPIGGQTHIALETQNLTSGPPGNSQGPISCHFPCFRHFLLHLYTSFSIFPGGSSGKESTFQCRRCGSVPGSGKFPGEGNGYPLQYSCLENPMDRRAWWATVHGVTKSWTRLSD